jgi:manganese efflux pump family protein
MKKLMLRWQIKSYLQLAIVFVVFAINGSLSAKIGYSILSFFNINKQNLNLIFYYLLLSLIVTLIYPFLIILIGFLFGQYSFFFKFSEKMLLNIGLDFIFNSKKNPD